MTTDNPETETRFEQRSERTAADEVTFPYQRLPLAAIARVLGTLCLVAVLLPFLVFAVPQTVGADYGFVILSGSMAPSLSPGDVVIVGGGGSAQVGDVITFATGGSVPVTHRVIGVEDGQYVTKGDANENPDGELVAPSAVLGRVVLTIPVIGYVILWANTPVGQLALVVVPLVLLGLTTLSRWSRDTPPVDDGRMDNATALAAMFDRVDDGQTGDETAPSATASGTETAPAAPVTDTVPADSMPDTELVPSPAPEADMASVVVAAPDLKLTLVASTALSGYAAWNVFRELGSAGAPHPVSVAVTTAGLLGVLFAVWTIYDGRRTRQATTAAEPRTAPDGGVDVEAER